MAPAFLLLACLTELIRAQSLAPATQNAAVGDSLAIWPFVLKALMIFSVNIALSGDNGVVIAMTVSTLPPGMKLRATAIGAALAIVCQVGATVFAVKLLQVKFIQLFGGVVIFWISVKLFGNSPDSPKSETRDRRFHEAIWLILIADLTMSTDNILAVAAMAKDNLALLLMGLGMSNIVVVCASTFLSLLIARFPPILYAGAAVLGNVAAEMVMADPFTQSLFNPGRLARYAIQAAAAILAVAIGVMIKRKPADSLQRDSGLH